LRHAEFQVREIHRQHSAGAPISTVPTS
jgi:hypothetical protein